MNTEAASRKIYFEKNIFYSCILEFTHTNGPTSVPHAHNSAVIDLIRKEFKS